MQKKIKMSKKTAFLVVFLLCAVFFVGNQGSLYAQDAENDRLQELLALTTEKIQNLPDDEREALAQEVQSLLVDKTKETIENNDQIGVLRDQLLEKDPKIQAINQKIRNLQSEKRNLVSENSEMVLLVEKSTKTRDQVLKLMKLQHRFK